MTAKHITLNLTVRLTPEQQNLLGDAAATVTDTQVHNFLIHGVGCHHADMLPENRRTVETLFRNGDLPVLVTTSTLAMGVNLPAHLVIIKTTKCYTDGEYRDYSESAILQMTGRAGRPLFDTSAYAVIMTTTNDKVSNSFEIVFFYFAFVRYYETYYRCCTRFFRSSKENLSVSYRLLE